ncbi:MAG: hypothetical protein A2908_02465 [Candidatus Staskawiczbacteria bacterium RIFCSPLOWO2_01_FULL_38_12b]|uniref:ATP-cone domain-containing protein n=1 Tax=Candidatus Staskawiczbacteria bacterium RIFCSPLOWO2_01_FULL_38_12b TaxID=1802214 RepID=A0A1G2IAV9_9BACT|nr:MAG: hypothetical protein A2908_02465 [Candidatus Staskawiczbacteria bacterium RIFCSPLOWO2_01_FULL_38_12b]
MITTVIKKDGTKVPFDLERMKSSIAAAAEDAGLLEEEKNSAVEQISSSVIIGLGSKEAVSSSEIKGKILAELEVSYPDIAQAWKKYEQSKAQ